MSKQASEWRRRQDEWYNKCLSVLRSCRNVKQLRCAHRWIFKSAEANKIYVFGIIKIDEIYDQMVERFEKRSKYF